MALQLRDCPQCGGPIVPHVFPSTGITQTPSSYAKRQFCSQACAGKAREGIPSATRHPDPERRCENCGAPMQRKHYGKKGRIESKEHFLSRRTCSRECSHSLIAREGSGNDWFPVIWHDLDPQVVGSRTLLARTCWGCGQLKDGGAFYRQGGGRQVRQCKECVSVQYYDTQDATRRQANRHGLVWTGPELEIVATRDDLTISQLAKMLGRTYAAVSAARHRVREPKLDAVAGASRSSAP